MNVWPSLFVSHGAPTLLIEEEPAHRYLSHLGQSLGSPRLILVLSAHHESMPLTITAHSHPPTIYDFYGFPDLLYEIRYPAPGDPLFAQELANRLNAAGFEAELDWQRGFDHGAWVPLALMYPQCQIPVLQLSLNPEASAEWHYRLGLALAPLREQQILILGSGSITHNLRAALSSRRVAGEDPAPLAAAFAHWVAEKVSLADWESVVRGIERGPSGLWNHPTPEHYYPLLVALGAAGSKTTGKRFHHSFTYQALAMDVYAFGKPDQLAALGSEPI